MRILIAGPGRGGTCLLTEVVRGLEIVQFSEDVEDRKFFYYEELPENYGTKNATEALCFTEESIRQLMLNYKDLRLVFTARHPVDTCLSKIRRALGREKRSADGTVEKAIDMVKKAYAIMRAMLNEFPERTIVVKFELLLLFPFKQVKRVADWFDVPLTDHALNPQRYNRNRYHRKRYGNTIDLLQIGIHMRPETAFGGFFKDRLDDIEKMKEELKNEISFHSGL